MHCGLDLAIPAPAAATPDSAWRKKFQPPRRFGSANRSGAFSPAMLHIGRRIRPASGQSATNFFISGQFHSSDSTPLASVAACVQMRHDVRHHHQVERFIAHRRRHLLPAPIDAATLGKQLLDPAVRRCQRPRLVGPGTAQAAKGGLLLVPYFLTF
jgi:hypothetical protein